MHTAVVARFHAVRFIPILLLGLFYGLAIAPPGIYNAEFLVSRGFRAESAGIMFVLASLIGIVLLAALPTLLARFGARRLLLGCTAIVGVAALGVATVSSAPFTAVFFLIFLSLPIILYSLIDVCIEVKVDGVEGVTGRARGLHLAVVNVAFTLGPVIAGFIISRHSFNALYLFAALMSAFFFAFTYHVTRKFQDPTYPHITPHYILRAIIKDSLTRCVLAINFLLQLRYAVIVVFLAIYLHQVLGFSLAAVGFMVTVANIPFILIQYPLGAIGDKWLGERELLVLGFILTCAGGFALAFIGTQSILVMIGILALMFTGAAIIEVMSESYFFKHIRGRDDAHIVAFRMLIPAAYIVAPLFSALIMIFLPMNYIFAAIALVCLLGIPLSLSLKDTR